MSEQTKDEKEEPCVRVFFPDVSEPYLYDPDCDTEFVRNKIGQFHHCPGGLRKRGSNRGVGTKTLVAGDYDFHIIAKTHPQPGK
jgi:hypothetical protein